MKTLIIFSVLFSFQAKSDEAAALNYLASQGLARDHYDAYQFHYTNKPNVDDSTVKAYSDLSRDNAVMNQGYNNPSQPVQVQNCYINQNNMRICN